MKALILTDDTQLRQASLDHFEQRARHSLPLTTDLLHDPRALADQLQHHAGSAVLCAPPAAGPDESWPEAVARLSENCRLYNCPMLLISSSRVFSGDKTSYREDAEPVDSSIWRLTEQAALQHNATAMVLRTSLLFSALPGNVLSTLLDSMVAGGEILCDNQYRSNPTASEDLARVISAVFDQLSCGAMVAGIYHYTGSESVTRYQFAEAVYAAASQYLDTERLASKLTAVEQNDPEWAAPRLSCDSIRDTFGIKQLPWRSFIGAAVSNYFTAYPS